MTLTEQMDRMLPAIESELQHQVARLDEPATRSLYKMLTYHMGWSGEGAGPETRGKRIRPFLLLLCASACKSNKLSEPLSKNKSKNGNKHADNTSDKWLRALPAAAAIELVHNFSLIHDDIEDNSDRRHGRPTVWKKWSLPHAINAGDALFVLSNLAVTDLEKHFSPATVMRVARVLQQTCLDLTRGQFLDMSFEERNDVTPGDYWEMIEGKTAALISACTEIGAILGGADEQNIRRYRAFGNEVGLAFQVKDDILGIWGKESLTGKSSASDLAEGKKSLPVILGLERKGEFAKRWSRRSSSPEDIALLAQLLKDDGVYDLVATEEKKLSHQALEYLADINQGNDAGQAMEELTQKLLYRES